MRGRPRLVFVDWELASLGEPAWDLGCAIAEYALAWLRSAETYGVLSPDRIESCDRLDIRTSRAAMAALWTSYLAEVGGLDECSTDFATAVVRLAGARLLQSALETTADAVAVPHRAVYLVQLGRNVLVDPANALESLFGLPADSTVP
jgi:aminoglycoside phosphotransferase (APT) family kinase protein